jgi:hypothetical protein
LWLTVLGGAAVAATLASVASGDLIAGDLRNDVGGAVQAGVSHTRAGLPATETSFWWLEAKHDVVVDCNADATHPVTVRVASTSSAVVLSPSAVQVTGCGPAAAGALPYRLTAGMPLGRTSLRGTASGGKLNSHGSGGTYTSKTLAININPRQINGLVAARAGAGSALSWTDSPDHALITAYQVRRRVGVVGAYPAWSHPLAEIHGTSFGDSNLKPAELHCYQVRAVFRQVVNGITVLFPSGQGAESCMVTPPRSSAREMLLELLAGVINDLIKPPALKALLTRRVEAMLAGFDPTVVSHRLSVCRSLSAFNGIVRLHSGHGIAHARATKHIKQSKTIRTVLGC